jgi:DNA-binding MarR family transcriptional regulator
VLLYITLCTQYAQGGFGVENGKLAVTIKFIDNAIKNARNDDLKGVDLTAAQMDVLMHLLFHQGHEINQKDIEKEFRIKNPTATGILKRLEGKGLIMRTVNPKDERSKQIAVTEKARQLHIKVYEKIDIIEKTLLKGFSPKEQNDLRMLLQRALENLKEGHQSIRKDHK